MDGTTRAFALGACAGPATPVAVRASGAMVATKWMFIAPSSDVIIVAQLARFVGKVSRLDERRGYGHAMQGEVDPLGVC